MRERRFVERVAEELERKHQQKAFDQLIIAAAPTALGDIRPVLSKELKSTIIAELPKDLTNIPTPKLEQHFADIRRSGAPDYSTTTGSPRRRPG